MMNQYKILVIEDSQTQAFAIAAHLTERDIDVIIANDGPQGLRMTQVMSPHLILLDVNLPNMSGYQVCKRLKRDIATSHIPVIMLTGEIGLDERQQGLDAGADDYIYKDQDAVENVLSALKTHCPIG